MLQFFRRHQKAFFLITSVVVISTFVFYGTSQAFVSRKTAGDETVLTTSDGKKVSRNHLSDMCRFLAMETPWQGTLPFGNFLNDGVLTRDFLQTGMARVLIEAHPERYEADFKLRLAKERTYTPFVHSRTPLISSATVWEMFSPEMNKHLKTLKACADPMASDALDARIQLYLAEMTFPPLNLTQALRYQEREAGISGSDARLMRGDLNLFGYKDLSEWFGHQFVEDAARFIIETAAVARTRGYKVTRDEVYTDLVFRSGRFFEMVKERLRGRVPNGYAFLNDTLRQLGMEEKTVTRIWEDVLLFRRYFNDIASATPVDTLSMKQFYGYAKEYATVEVTRLPSEFAFKNVDDLKRFEAYLQAVGEDYSGGLELPTHYLPVEACAPELVGQKYVLNVASVTKEALQAKVSLKQTWEWQVTDENWPKLSEKFPGFAPSTAKIPEERFDHLQALPVKERARVDRYTRKLIVEEHPEWIEESLAENQAREQTLFVRGGGAPVELAGIDDSESFMRELEGGESLVNYSQDGETFYSISVKEKGEKEILTFAQALEFEAVDGKKVSVVDLLLKLGKKEPAFRMESAFAQTEVVGPLARQWQPVKKLETITRASTSLIPFEKLSSLEKEPQLLLDEGLVVIDLVDQKRDTTLPHEKVLQAQEMLSSEAKCHLMRALLENLSHQHA